MPYDAVKHATHIRAEADKMHAELLRQVDALMCAEPGTEDEKELERLSKLVADYEEVRWSLELSQSESPPASAQEK